MKRFRNALLSVLLALAVMPSWAETPSVAGGTQRCLLGRRDCTTRIVVALDLWDGVLDTFDCDLEFVSCWRRLFVGR